ncbi:unnamed protein product [Cuscuta epithymum]|uniref:Rhodopsin n=1 Tax=Cuscuta epithymum TaxID=186058 RepID=A0AAV0GJ76_9ASTE|nr:unnamed protein product [Cuscuta epithymum]CAH9147955.1 unnamed protein product [Cuscuta epithymum]
MSYYNQGQQPPPVGVPPPQGYSQQDAAYNKDATPGYPPPQGYPQQGYPPQGYPPQVYPPQGYPPQGYAPQYVPQYAAPPPPPPQQQANNSGCLEGWLKLRLAILTLLGEVI